jgi:hypothetical protein
MTQFHLAAPQSLMLGVKIGLKSFLWHVPILQCTIYRRPALRQAMDGCGCCLSEPSYALESFLLSSA